MLDYLRRNGAARISDLVAETGVTATAVRQRIAAADGRGADRAARGDATAAAGPIIAIRSRRKASNRPGTIFPTWRSCCGKRSRRSPIPRFAADC